MIKSLLCFTLFILMTTAAVSQQAPPVPQFEPDPDFFKLPRCGAQEKARWTPKRPCGNEATFSLAFSRDPAQTYVYSADGGSHFITVLRRSDLEVVNEFGGPGVGPGQLGRPHNLTVDPSGNLFVAEAAGPEVKHPATGATVQAGFRAQKFALIK